MLHHHRIDNIPNTNNGTGNVPTLISAVEGGQTGHIEPGKACLDKKSLRTLHFGNSRM